MEHPYEVQVRGIQSQHGFAMKGDVAWVLDWAGGRFSGMEKKVLLFSSSLCLSPQGLC